MSKVIKYKKTPSVFGTGLIALDIVVSADADEPAYEWAGGTCGNVLTILAYLGWRSYPVARLNQGASSIRAMKDMERWGVRMDFAQLSLGADVPVITQEITSDEKGAPKHKFHWKNCPKCGAWLPNYKAVTLKGTKVVKETVKHGDVYFFDRTSAGALDLARYFKEKGAIIFFEPSAKGDAKHFEEAMSLADIIKYSDQRFPLLAEGRDKAKTPVVEIQTLGAEGLQYRTRARKKWRRLPAFRVDELKDTSGCGDWTSAGIISRLCANGLEGLLAQSEDSIEEALKYGQALGAWNCGFKGARRGMYEVSKKTFAEEIEAICQEGTFRVREERCTLNAEHASDGLCPSCPH